MLSLAIALLAPSLSVAYLRPILAKVLRELCNSDSGAEFWIRCTYLLAISGSLLLMLIFGDFRDDISLINTLRRSLVLVFAGVFFTVAVVSRNIWKQVRQPLPAHGDTHSGEVVGPT